MHIALKAHITVRDFSLFFIERGLSLVIYC